MCLFTHFAAGALAGGATGNVWVGAVAGLASHAVLDMIPHWDHPDWRVELGAGLASLVLLLMMPFATAPAIVGGIMGMVPDLENLFQKVGWMSRGQFVFPTHTGLLRHGRALGPRSLAWQFVIFIACFAALGLIAPGTATAAEGETTAVLGLPVVQVLQADEQRTVVRLSLPVERAPADWDRVDPRLAVWPIAGWTGEPGVEDVPPLWTLPVAVPTRGPVQARVLAVSWWKEPDGTAVPTDLVTAGTPAVHRGVPIAGAVVALSSGGGILRDVTIELAHPPTGRERENLTLAGGGEAGLKIGTEPVPAGVLNPDLYLRLSDGARARALAERRPADKAAPGALFAATANWLKLDVATTGFYRVTGQDLAGWGVPTTAVDPTKLRLFRGGGLQLLDNPELPDSVQSRRVGLTEVAVEVTGTGDGEWNLDDELRFYGVGTSTWLDRFDPSAGRLDHYDHPAQSTAVYWLTWEGDAVPSPLPGTPKRVVPVAAPALGATVETAGMVRVHREEQVLEDIGLVADNFVWANTITSSRTETFNLRNPVPGAAARFSVEIRAARWFASYVAQAWLNGDQAGAATINFTSTTQQDSLRVRVIGESAAVTAGQNTLTLRNGLTGNGQLLALDSFGVMMAARLDVGDGQGPLQFGLWGDEVAAPASPTDVQVAAPVPADLLLWDVTVPDSALALAGTAGPGRVTYGLLRDPGSDRHLVAARRGDLARPAAGRRVQPVDLRGRSALLDYVVIAPQGFINAAGDLADYRSAALPGVAAPSAAAVLVDDIYDNFAGGQKDWRAIRNYLRWVYTQGGNRLRYACLLGNASRDPRNWKNKTPYVDLADLVPTEIRTEFPDNPTYPYGSPYASDDALVSFDAVAAVGYIDFDTPDLACGRLPALTPAEARDMVDRAIAYDRYPVTGTWRNRIVLTADDANRPGVPYPLNDNFEDRHTRQAEILAENYVPLSVDVDKIYAAAYPFPPGSGIKPQVRAEINAALDAGTTMFYYVGHGAEDNLADEQIFRSQDISGLTNGMERFVFLAFSCDVGVYDSLVRRSMAEQFVAAPGGGAIAAVCASQVSYVSSNEFLSNAYYSNLYPGRSVDPARSLGEALRLAKGAMVSVGLRDNSQRYNLMGDPATVLPHPDDVLAFAPASLDTLRTGLLHRAVVADGTAGGHSYELEVRDAAQPVGVDLYSQRPDPNRPGQYIWVATGFLSWFADGAPVFRGSGSVDGGDLVVPFKAPLQLGLGERGRVRLIIRGADGDRAAVDRIPVVSGGTGPSDDLLGPAIALAFADGATRVQPGARLEAVLSDSSGIAMLGTSPGNSILLEFDDSGFMTNVTAAFAYDPDSYTSGRLAFGLPSDLAPGRHTAALYAADALGNVGSDTLSFDLGAAGITDIGTVSLFPNPTAGPCRLIFELSDPMEVRWDIYTVSGRRVRSLHERFGASGPGIIDWDGRDGEGDEIANGTYLYVLRGLGAGGDGRDITRTGKLVIMR